MSDLSMIIKLFEDVSLLFCDIIVKKGGKDQEKIQSSTTPDPGYHKHESMLSPMHYWILTSGLI